MAQLGSGSGSSYPSSIDTHQVYQNGVTPAPDGPTRVDCEVLNDSLEAIVAVETTLGANVQGSFASLAARLDAFLPTPSERPHIVFFTNTTTVTIPGSTHDVETNALLFEVYDDQTPAAVILPQSITVHPSSYDVVVEFAAPQSGVVVLAAPSPRYVAAFTSQTTVTVPGATHALGTGRLLWQLYDAASPANGIAPSQLTVHPSTFAVVVTFAAAQSGTLVLTAGGPRYEVTFTNQTTVTVLGTTHDLLTPHLVWALYDDQTPAVALQPSAVTVHPETYDVQVHFAAPQSGVLILTSAVSPATLLLAQLGLPPWRSTAVLVADTPSLVLTLRSVLARLMRLETAYAALQASLPSAQEGA